MYRLAALVSALAVASCTHDPGPPPIVSIADRACTAQPVLSNAKPVVLDGDKSVTVKLDGTAPCWEADGAKSVYSMFDLPQSPDPVLVSVLSDPLGQGVFAPRVIVLDGDQHIMRELPRDSFMFHGASLYVGIRLHAGERYLIVASDPKTVGQQYTQASESTQVAAGAVVTGAAVGFFTVHTGSDSTSIYTYSYNGTVKVTAQPMPKGN